MIIVVAVALGRCCSGPVNQRTWLGPGGVLIVIAAALAAYGLNSAFGEHARTTPFHPLCPFLETWAVRHRADFSPAFQMIFGQLSKPFSLCCVAWWQVFVLLLGFGRVRRCFPRNPPPPPSPSLACVLEFLPLPLLFTHQHESHLRLSALLHSAIAMRRGRLLQAFRFPCPRTRTLTFFSLTRTGKNTHRQ